MTRAGSEKGVRCAARFIIWLLFAGLLPSVALAATSITLTWDASPDPTAAGYKVYYGTASGAYTVAIDAGNATLATISNLAPGTTYYFAATAYNTSGLESDYSTETSYSLPPVVVNLPPTLNPPADITINENAGVQTVTLSGISSGSPAESQVLSVTAFSSNPVLVPNPTVGYTSPNNTATLTFAPAANSFGSVTITAMVDDGASVSNTVIRTFNVTVLSVNQVPTLDPLANLTIDENAGVQTVNLSGISPGPGDTQAVTVTASSGNPALIPDPIVTYANPNGAGTLTFAPLTNAHGWAKITVSVDDGQPTNNLLTRSFIVTVQQTDPGTTNGTWTLWWQHTSGSTALWQMDGTNVTKIARLNAAPASTGWRIAGQADFDGDGHTDLLWQHTDGSVAIWLMNSTNFLKGFRVANGTAGAGWQIAGTGDLDGDGLPDIVWQHTSGVTAVWLMDGTNCVLRSRLNAPLAGPGWNLVGTGHFNGDGHTDLLWQNTSGATAVWLMDGTNCTSHFRLTAPPVDAGWKIVGVADINGVGHSDILWQSDSGGLAYWLMDTTNRVSVGRFSTTHVDPSWRVMGPR